MFWLASTSVTWLATTVTVQVAPAGRFAEGWSVKLVAGEAGLTEKATGVPVGHSILKAEPVTLTLSLKVTVTLVLATTFVAPLAGVVLVTVGGVSTVKLAV